MLIYKITLTINGEKFSPNKFLDSIENNFFIFDKNEPYELIWENKFDRYDFGSISIINNSIYCLKNEFDNYEKWYSNFFIQNLELLIKSGVNKVIYNLDIFYTDFCSFELSCTENYRSFLDFNLSLPINIYKVTEKEILEMLIEHGYDSKFISNYEW